MMYNLNLKKKMEVEYSYWTGTIDIVVATLSRSIGQYIRNYESIKIGITCDPERRCKQHEKSADNWDRMIVKYRTSSVKYINMMEKILIEKHWPYIKNEVAGGGGPNGNAPYYLYILIKK